MPNPFDDLFGQSGHSASRGSSSSWQVGDRVLAPWEPSFLYAGTIREFRDDEVHIQFDDGDEGWVFVKDLRPLKFEIDQAVMSRKQMGPLFYPATIDDMSGEDVRVAFNDGEMEWTTVAALRIPRPAGEGAAPTGIASDRAFLSRVTTGSRVLAPWESFFLYPGTVGQVVGNEAHIQYDDGDQGWVHLEQILPLEIRQGLTVQIRRPDRLYEPGEVVSVSGTSVQVSLESGGTRWVAVSALRIPYVGSGPNARPAGDEAPVPVPAPADRGQRAPGDRDEDWSRPATSPGKGTGMNFGVGFLLGALVSALVLAVIIFALK